MIALDGLLRAELALFLLECARVSGVIIVAPLAWINAPVRIKVALVLMLAFVVHGLSNQAIAPRSAFETGLSLCTEFTVGIAMGFVVRIVIAIAEICGEIISPSIGLGIANAFDPTTQAQTSVISNVLRHLAIFIALIIGVHRVVLGGLLAGFRLLPVGTAGPPGQLLPLFVELSSFALEAGVRIALPIVAILYMTQLALAFIARAAPQIQVFNVGFAVMLAVGLFLLATTLPDISRSFIIELSQVGPKLEELLETLGAVP